MPRLFSGALDNNGYFDEALTQRGSHLIDISSKKLISKAPAKLILTGEHAVLYGCPVIASSVDRFATTTISPSKVGKYQKGICSISLEDIRSHVTGTVQMFLRVKDRLLSSYKKFITGRRSIRDVLKHPRELFEFALGTVFENCYLELKEALDIRISSTIPVGCGMGSSAATVVSLVKALVSHFGVDKKYEWIERAVCEIERLQHGRSSGVDTYLSLHGGTVIYELGKSPQSLESLAQKHLKELPLWIINTGKPESTTGECVDFVRRSSYGRESHSIWNDFKDISQDFYSALVSGSLKAIQEQMALNQELLFTLGVVPQKVNIFIQRAALECGSIMKSTGAGAVRGDSSGVILGCGPMPSLSLLQEFGFPRPESITLGLSGVGIVHE